MIGHITYLSDESMHAKFGRRLRDRDDYAFDFVTEFEVESYLAYQGKRFVERFDANTYLYMTKAMDYFDLRGDADSLAEALAGTPVRFLRARRSRATGCSRRTSRAEIVDALLAGAGHVRRDRPARTATTRSCSSRRRSTRFIEPFLDARARRGVRGAGAVTAGDAHVTAGRAACAPTSALIIELVPEGSRVLDLGCGDGALLAHLRDERGCTVRGVELDPATSPRRIAQASPSSRPTSTRVSPAVPDDAFDYVVLSQTLQVVRKPALVLREMLRVGKHGIVSFPNFGHWRVRGYLALGPHAGVGGHPVLLVRHAQHPPHHDQGLPRLRRGERRRIEQEIPLLAEDGAERRVRHGEGVWPNLFADTAVAVVRKRGCRSSRRAVSGLEKPDLDRRGSRSRTPCRSAVTSGHSSSSARARNSAS